MEICRKLDSIRAAGFPEGTTAAPAGFAAAAPAAAPAGDSPARPSSEPLPELVTDIAGQERPGTAISATEAVAPGGGYHAPSTQWDDTDGDGNSAGARELSSTPPTLSQNSQADSKGKVEVEQFEAESDVKERIPEQQAARAGDGGEGEAVREHDEQAPIANVPCEEKSTVEKGVHEKVATGRRKQKAVRELSWVMYRVLYLLRKADSMHVESGQLSLTALPLRLIEIISATRFPVSLPSTVRWQHHVRLWEGTSRRNR